MNRLIRTTLAAAALVAPVTVLGAAAPAQAGNPTPPPTLTPAPPDYYSCTTTGSGTYCSGQTIDAYGPDPAGLFCGTGASAFEIFDQAVRVVDAQRWYDRDGNIVKRRRVFTFEHASFSGPSGAMVAYAQRDVDIDVFGVPGDITTGTTYANGSLRATAPRVGAVLVEKGRTVWGTDGSLAKEAGRHDLLDGALGPLCAALGG